MASSWAARLFIDKKGMHGLMQILSVREAHKIITIH